jgi:hypothetical protein
VSVLLVVRLAINTVYNCRLSSGANVWIFFRNFCKTTKENNFLKKLFSAG